MRLFIAAGIPDDVKKRIMRFQKTLVCGRCRIKITEEENLHFTLKFLGDVDEGEAGKVEQSILSALGDFSPFRISVEGAGFFGRPKAIRIVWAGVNNGRDELVKLMNALDRKLDYIRKNEHTPSPHITIARVKAAESTAGLAHIISSHNDVKFGEFELSGVSLKQSTLTGHGPVYADLRVFHLRRQNNEGE